MLPTRSGATSGTHALSARQTLSVGVALFSMFFGAGNLILPPLLGAQAGQETLPAIIGFFITGVGLPVLGIVAVALSGTARELTARVHPCFSRVFVAAVYLAIGPCLAIPRTSSTAFEMMAPLLSPDVDLALSRCAFSVAFFALAYVLAMRPGRITELLGKVTGPMLIALIVMLVGSSLLFPGGEPAPARAPYDGNTGVQGFLTGYQTMDLLASLTFGLVIAASIRGMGVTDSRGVTREVCRAGVVAGALMMLIYGGLAMVGMQLSGSMPHVSNGAAVLSASASAHFGTAGAVVIAVIFLLACLNVCIGLIGCCGTYFAQEFPRVPYRAWAFGFAVFSCAISNVGLDAILAFSVPLLNALYPVAIVLVVMGLFHRVCDGLPQMWPWVVGVVAVVSVAGSVRDALAPGAWLPIDVLPFSSMGLGWLIPALAAAAMGAAHAALVRLADHKA